MPGNCREKSDKVIRKIRMQYFNQCQFCGALEERFFCKAPTILFSVPIGHTQPQKTRPRITVAMITKMARKNVCCHSRLERIVVMKIRGSASKNILTG